MIDLKFIRKKYSFTQKYMAESLGVCIRGYHMYEHGQRELPKACEKLLGFLITKWEKDLNND